MPEKLPPTCALPAPSRLTDGQKLQVDGLVFAVKVSARRKRLGLTVERDGSLTLRAPDDCAEARALTFLKKSRAWVEGKLRAQEEYPPAHPARSFKEGEIFRYLGREYRLQVSESEEERGPVRLVAGHLVLSRAAAGTPARARREVIAWYRKSGLRWARGRLQPWAARMEVPEPSVDVRDVGNRWGTYRPEDDGPGRMALHWSVFQLPAHLVDYVIAHELAHIRIAGHGSDYWALLRRALPACEEYKREVDDLGRRLWLGAVGS